MSSDSPTDLFPETFPQGELFAGQRTERRSETVTPEEIRKKMQKIVEQLRDAEAMPWAERTVRINEVIFPQMARWLPAQEAEKLCVEFRKEIERIRELQSA